MRKCLIALPVVVALTAIVTYFASLYVFERPEFGDSVERASLWSAKLEEQREYLVHLPTSYDQQPSQHYPVIFVLDGSSQDVHTAASAAVMHSIGVMPEVIVVGISNVSGDGRQRDYTPPGMLQDLDDRDSAEGRADAFLGFMRDELIPEIERRYRTSSSRMLAGNSRGGLFVVYALATEPSLFDAYLANSPSVWRKDGEMVKRLDRFLVEHPALHARLFLSLGSEENDKMKDAFLRATGVLRQRAPASLHWWAQLTPGASHGNNAELATPVALRWLFDPGWLPPSTLPGP